MRISPVVWLAATIMTASLTACSSSGGSGYSSTSGVRTTMSVGYHTGFYGHRPYYGYRPPIVVVPDPGPGIDRPVAAPLPSIDGGFGMPDAGFDDFPDIDF